MKQFKKRSWVLTVEKHGLHVVFNLFPNIRVGLAVFHNTFYWHALLEPWILFGEGY